MRIILLGFRYSGKSLIGKAIAQINGLKFIDLDDEIEKLSNKNINNIVKQKNGWNNFRELEIMAFNNAIKQNNVVISCGGGFAVNNQFCEKRNKTFGEIERDILSQVQAIKLLFEIDKDCLLRRIKSSNNRPSFNKGGKICLDKQQIYEENLSLYETRKSTYNSLDFDAKIDTSNDNFCNAILSNCLYCVVGNPVWHSLSPKIHNFFINELIKEKKEKNNALKNFVYTKCEIKEENFDEIIKIFKILNIQGASITSPFKQKIMKFLTKIDNESKKINAVNTIIFDSNSQSFFGCNTDYIGVIKALENNIANIKDKRVAVFGSGGGAKSAVIGCLKYTNKITMFNRTPDKNEIFAKQNGIKSYKISAFCKEDFDIIINATTLGLNNNKSILPKTKLKNHIVFDMVYSPLNTKLLNNAINKNCKIIYGIEMLIYQAQKQFELFFGEKINDNYCEKLLLSLIENSSNCKKCLVVKGKNIKEFLKNICRASKCNNFLELRVDYIKDLKNDDIEKIANEVLKIKKSIKDNCNKLIKFETIFTIRLKKDGGEFLGDFLTHKKIIKRAISLNAFDFFDFDISSVDRFLEILKNNKINKNFKSIISYHNFNQCLSYTNTKKLVEKMVYFGDIIKLSMIVKTAQEISTMATILEEFNHKRNNIIFAPIGSKIVRILAWKLGSWCNFLCLNDKEKTAEGQITIKEADKIVEFYE